MKLGRFTLMVTAAVFILTLGALPAMAASMWRLSNQFPPSILFLKVWIFAERVAEYSGGEMKVRGISLCTAFQRY